MENHKYDSAFLVDAEKAAYQGAYEGAKAWANDQMPNPQPDDERLKWQRRAKAALIGFVGWLASALQAPATVLDTVHQLLHHLLPTIVGR